MHRHTLLTLYSCVITLLSLRCAAQQTAAATLELRLAQPASEAGAQVRLEIVLKNMSSEELSIPKEPGNEGHAEDYLSIQVRDSEGLALERIDRQTFVKNGKAYSFPKRGWGSHKSSSIEPGDESHDFLVLSDLFNLSKPGSYTVSAKAELRRPYSGPEIKWAQTPAVKINFAVKN